MTGPDEVTDLLVRLREARIGVDSISMDKPSLDEVFLTLTGHGVRSEEPAEPGDGRPAGADAPASTTTREAALR